MAAIPRLSAVGIGRWFMGGTDNLKETGPTPKAEATYVTIVPAISESHLGRRQPGHFPGPNG